MRKHRQGKGIICTKPHNLLGSAQPGENPGFPTAQAHPQHCHNSIYASDRQPSKGCPDSPGQMHCYNHRNSLYSTCWPSVSVRFSSSRNPAYAQFLISSVKVRRPEVQVIRELHSSKLPPPPSLRCGLYPAAPGGICTLEAGQDGGEEAVGAPLPSNRGYRRLSHDTSLYRPGVRAWSSWGLENVIFVLAECDPSWKFCYSEKREKWLSAFCFHT